MVTRRCIWKLLESLLVESHIHRSHSGVKHEGLVISTCEKGRGLVSNHIEGKTERKALGSRRESAWAGTRSLIIHCPRVGLENVRGLQNTHTINSWKEISTPASSLVHRLFFQGQRVSWLGPLLASELRA